MLKGHTRFSVDAEFGNNRAMIQEHDIISFEKSMEVLTVSNNSKAVNFMYKPLFNYEILRKKNKDVPQISK